MAREKHKSPSVGMTGFEKWGNTLFAFKLALTEFPLIDLTVKIL